MGHPSQAEKAARFRALHQTGCFILPNAWNVPSALMALDAGFEAVGTTSAGVALAQGLNDGERIGLSAMLDAGGAIAARLPLPVTLDLESGYGDPAGAVRQAIAAGLVGCNLEDSDPAARRLRPIEEAAANLAAARQAAEAAGLPDFVLNARIDTFFLGRLPPDEAFAQAVERAARYRAAGADSIFVPGPGDAATARRLAEAIAAPLNIMAGGFGPTAPRADLAAAGVRRISLGASLMASAYGHARSVLTLVRDTGRFDYTAEAGSAFMTLAGLTAGHPDPGSA